MDFSNRKKKRAAAITTPSVGFLIQKVCWPSEIRCELSFSVTAQEGTLSALNDILTANPFQRFVFVVFCRLSSSSILFFFNNKYLYILYIYCRIVYTAQRVCYIHMFCILQFQCATYIHTDTRTLCRKYNFFRFR